MVLADILSAPIFLEAGREREREVGSRRCAAIQIRCNVAKFVLKRRGVTGRFLGVTRVKRAGDGMPPVAENVVASRLGNRVFINTNKVNRARYAFSRGLKCFRNIERTFAYIYIYIHVTASIETGE